ncbi:MAG: response regulator transcription factor [Ktedonobacteraceae bacterium]|nr:response regulator transcription factor [Ktedonobacteraceae bacterium]
MIKVMLVDHHSLMRRAVREVLEQESDLSVVAEANNELEAETLATETQPDVLLIDPDIPGGQGLETMEHLQSCSPNARMVVFVSTHQEQRVFEALQRGAIGYLTRDVEPDALIHAIHCAARNDLCIPGTLASSVVAYLRTMEQAQESSPWRPASPRLDDRNLSFTKAFTSCWSPTPDMIASMNTLSRRVPRRARRTRKSSQDPSSDAISPTRRPLTDREHQIRDLLRRGQKNREIARELSIAESTVHKHVQNIFEKLHARNRTEAIYLTSSGA